jgi:SAM-dependent methyltransferase
MAQEAVTDAIYYWSAPPGDGFEETYTAVRSAEQRLLTDAEVQQLPFLPLAHPQAQEWRYRADTFGRLYHFLRTCDPCRILDLGCGNGWLAPHLTRLSHTYRGVEINQAELQQAARLFQSADARFIYWNAMADDTPEDFEVDMVLIQASIPYFPDLRQLLSRLQRLLAKGGAVHILDSPVYPNPQAAEQARKRSQAYYNQQGYPGMHAFYYHHSWASLAPFNYEVLYQPDTWLPRLKRLIGKKASPFPWIRIPKQP